MSNRPSAFDRRRSALDEDVRIVRTIRVSSGVTLMSCCISLTSWVASPAKWTATCCPKLTEAAMSLPAAACCRGAAAGALRAPRSYASPLLPGRRRFGLLQPDAQCLQPNAQVAHNGRDVPLGGGGCSNNFSPDSVVYFRSAMVTSHEGIVTFRRCPETGSRQASRQISVRFSLHGCRLRDANPVPDRGRRTSRAIRRLHRHPSLADIGHHSAGR
jgi:hypothetical protein